MARFWEELGFRVIHGPAKPMTVAHSHLEIELGLSNADRTSMLYGGTRLDYGVQANVFWAVIPHQVVAVDPVGAQAWSINIPVAWLLNWQLPQPFVRRLLQGEIISDADPDHCRYLLAQLQQWSRDLEQGTTDRETAMMEVQASLRRLAVAADRHAVRNDPGGYTGAFGIAQQLATYLLEHYAEPVSMKELAAVAGMHEKSVIRFYKQTTGMTLWQSLTAFRLYQAQRLLLTTDQKVIEIAAASGFATLSNFYQAFRRQCGMSPGRYRRQLRTGI